MWTVNDLRATRTKLFAGELNEWVRTLLGIAGFPLVPINSARAITLPFTDPRIR